MVVKGGHPWNKGISPSEGTRKKISVALKGRKLSEEQKNVLSEMHKGCRNTMYGRSPPNKGKTHSQEAREKMSKALKGTHSVNEWKKGHVPWNKGRKCPQIAQALIGDNHPSHKHAGENHWNRGRTGPKSPGWKGGLSYVPYCYKFNKELKERVRERDNRTCQLCGVKENGKTLHVHHIHYDKDNCYPDLITLCQRCNAIANGNRDYHEKLFMNKLSERGLLFWTVKSSTN